MTAQCRLLRPAGAAFPWDWTRGSQAPPPPHTTAPAAGSAAPPRPCALWGAGFQRSLVPSLQAHSPSPDKANIPCSRSPSCCIPPSGSWFGGPFCPLAVPPAFL